MLTYDICHKADCLEANVYKDKLINMSSLDTETKAFTVSVWQKDVQIVLSNGPMLMVYIYFSMSKWILIIEFQIAILYINIDLILAVKLAHVSLEMYRYFTFTAEIFRRSSERDGFQQVTGVRELALIGRVIMPGSRYIRDSSLVRSRLSNVENEQWLDEWLRQTLVGSVL